jgi:hypothetical protein
MRKKSPEETCDHVFHIFSVSLRISYELPELSHLWKVPDKGSKGMNADDLRKIPDQYHAGPPNKNALFFLAGAYERME